MNGLERRYHDLLHLLYLDGQILDVAFEPERLRLADCTFYIPDFRIIRPDGIVEFHEVKGGFWREDARVKIKTAAEAHPYVFRAVTEVNPRKPPKRVTVRIERGSVWSWETFSRGAPRWLPDVDRLPG